MPTFGPTILQSRRGGKSGLKPEDSFARAVNQFDQVRAGGRVITARGRRRQITLRASRRPLLARPDIRPLTMEYVDTALRRGSAVRIELVRSA